MALFTSLLPIQRGKGRTGRKKKEPTGDHRHFRKGKKGKKYSLIRPQQKQKKKKKRTKISVVKGKGGGEKVVPKTKINKQPQ